MKKYIFVLFVLFSNIVLGADLEVVARIPLAENIKDRILISSLVMRRSDCSTKFMFDSGSGAQLIIIFDTNGFWHTISGRNSEYRLQTNIIGTFVENGIVKVIQDETYEIRDFLENPSAVYNSLSKDGFYSIVNEAKRTTVSRYKVSADTKEKIDQHSLSESYLCHVIRYKINKEPISTNTFSGNSIRNNYSDADSLQFSPPGGRYKHLIAEKVDDYLVIYNLDIDQVKPNPVGPSIRIESSNETGIDAVINSETGKTVRVQSSRDNIDWTDVNTIQNPNGKKIFLPFSQQKEFIRGVE